MRARRRIIPLLTKEGLGEVEDGEPRFGGWSLAVLIDVPKQGSGVDFLAGLKLLDA